MGLFALVTRNTSMRRLAIIITFLAMGRAGEASCTTWNRLIWDYKLCTFLLNWNKRKTSDSDVLPFFADAESMYLDIFHALACYLILGGVKADERSATADRWNLP
jgi:hypothetical protein